MKIAVSIFVLIGSVAYAQNPHGFHCEVDNAFGNSAIHAEVAPAFSVGLIDANSETILASMTQMCGRPMDFQKNCTLVDNSQSNFVSYSASCYENNDSNGSWLAKFDISFYESNGLGISHCTGAALPINSYKLKKCTRY